jgi:hypothetical protein
MAYDATNPERFPYLTIAGNGGTYSLREWHYKSADTIATVRVDGYISNGAALGMKLYDVVTVVDTTTPAVQKMVVAAVNANGSIDLSDGTAISTTDTD